MSKSYFQAGRSDDPRHRGFLHAKKFRNFGLKDVAPNRLAQKKYTLIEATGFADRSAFRSRGSSKICGSSDETGLIADMARPSRMSDAILGHVASWGDRFPIRQILP